jgi:hypothetical protein
MVLYNLAMAVMKLLQMDLSHLLLQSSTLQLKLTDKKNGVRSNTIQTWRSEKNILHYS